MSCTQPGKAQWQCALMAYSGRRGVADARLLNSADTSSAMQPTQTNVYCSLYWHRPMWPTTIYDSLFTPTHGRLATHNSYDIHRPVLPRRCRSNSYIAKPIVTLTMPTLVVQDRYFTVSSIFSRTQASAYTAQTIAKCTEFDPLPLLLPDLTLTTTRLYTIWPRFFENKSRFLRTFQAPKIMDPYFSNFQESVANPSEP